PVSRFATYGSGLATPTELNGLLQLGRRAKGSGPFDTSSCPPDPPHLSDVDRTTFPASCNECFSKLVDRALAVHSHLSQIERCIIQKAGANQILAAREVNGAPDNIAPLANVLTNICPLYQFEIAPLWPEAEENCALAYVLIQFSLSLDRQIQLLGAAEPPCPYRLEDNLAAACTSARECLHETALCCGIGGHKGPEKVAEALTVIKQFALMGVSCFPDDAFSDPDVKNVVTECTSNAWYGTMTFKQKGVDSYTTQNPNGSSAVEQKVDFVFNGQGWSSFELLPPGDVGYLIIDASGSGLIRVHGVRTDTTDFHCTDPPGPGTWNLRNEFESIITTNYFGATNDNTVGVYEFSFTLETNKTYELQVYDGAGWELSADTHTDVRGWYQGNCSSKPADYDYSNTSKTFYHFPAYNNVLGASPVFQMPDPNTVAGALDWQETNSDAPQGSVVLATHLEWNFRRNTNAPPQGP
ncbi:MAG TPA: hypothetical protein VHI52_19230, partial [Verrucomicrobiae bacterium]|nr:hypothetical protein [Verrucomicrobiae bacterium]